MQAPLRLIALFYVNFVGFVGFVILMSAAANAATERWERHHVMASPEKTSEVVASSWEGGAWSYSDMSGHFKLLYTQNEASASGELLAQRVYLQWVRTDQAGSELVYSIALKEVSSVPTFTFELPQCVEFDGKACGAFELGATHVFEESSAIFQVEPGGLGQYGLRSVR
ncbi:hypothetical protein [Saccharophagus degradans]|uniref:Uncharacterized protein n=1 Tax=Saccharophagus degradans (strain 2-40 / ATCC 43961 / DSM 17024) TaxID=203122 RepID=Q21JJ3_SACD2|nr:hypothetical protein [Saccharophagus degradans]ABD81136.1 hypothetical protein Sde_1876 [Saccharophagus degradans 2-40]